MGTMITKDVIHIKKIIDIMGKKYLSGERQKYVFRPICTVDSWE
jgi:hypothetical protein